MFALVCLCISGLQHNETIINTHSKIILNRCFAAVFVATLPTLVTVSVVSNGTTHEKKAATKRETNKNNKAQHCSGCVLLAVDALSFSFSVSLPHRATLNCVHFNWVGYSLTHFSGSRVHVYGTYYSVWRSLSLAAFLNSPELVYAQIALVTGSYSRCMVVYIRPLCRWTCFVRFIFRIGFIHT